MIYAVLSNFDFVAKFTVKNLNKDFINAVRGGGGHRFMKIFHKIPVFFERWLPLKQTPCKWGLSRPSTQNHCGLPTQIFGLAGPPTKRINRDKLNH